MNLQAGTSLSFAKAFARCFVPTNLQESMVVGMAVAPFLGAGYWGLAIAVAPFVWVLMATVLLQVFKGLCLYWRLYWWNSLGARDGRTPVKRYWTSFPGALFIYPWIVATNCLFVILPLGVIVQSLSMLGGYRGESLDLFPESMEREWLVAYCYTAFAIGVMFWRLPAFFRSSGQDHALGLPSAMFAALPVRYIASMTTSRDILPGLLIGGSFLAGTLCMVAGTPMAKIVVLVLMKVLFDLHEVRGRAWRNVLAKPSIGI